MIKRYISTAIQRHIVWHKRNQDNCRD